MAQNSKELRGLIRQYQKMATDAARLVCLNPQNAETWMADARKFRALAAAAEVDLQILRHRSA